MLGGKIGKGTVIAGLAGLLSLEACTVNFSDNYYDNGLRRPTSVVEENYIPVNRLYGPRFNPMLFNQSHVFFYNGNTFFFSSFDQRSNMIWFQYTDRNGRRQKHKEPAINVFNNYSIKDHNRNTQRKYGTRRNYRN